MLAIADEIERQGRDPRGTSLRIGVFGAEPWTSEMRAEIEKRLNIDAIDLYGLSEVIDTPADTPGWFRVEGRCRTTRRRPDRCWS